MENSKNFDIPDDKSPIFFNSQIYSFYQIRNNPNYFTFEEGTEETLDYFGQHGLMLIQSVGTFNLDSLKKGFIEYRLPVKANILNNMNIFSACDLSQCSVELAINSTCPLHSLNMNFDVPIELLPATTEPDHVDLYSIGYKDSLSLKNLNHKLTFYHFKLPTQANIQLVRSLIITTLLTALWSLFAVNVFYVCRRIFEKRKRKRKTLKFKYALKLYRYWISPIRFLIIMLFVGLTLLTILDVMNKPCFIYFDYIIIALIFLVIIIAFSIYYMRKSIFKANEDGLKNPIADSSDNHNYEEEMIQNIERKLNPYILFCPKCGSEKIEIKKDGFCKCEECQEEWKEFDNTSDTGNSDLIEGQS